MLIIGIWFSWPRSFLASPHRTLQRTGWLGQTKKKLCFISTRQLECIVWWFRPPKKQISLMRMVLISFFICFLDQWYVIFHKKINIWTTHSLLFLNWKLQQNKTEWKHRMRNQLHSHWISVVLSEVWDPMMNTEHWITTELMLYFVKHMRSHCNGLHIVYENTSFGMAVMKKHFLFVRPWFGIAR